MTVKAPRKGGAPCDFEGFLEYLDVIVKESFDKKRNKKKYKWQMKCLGKESNHSRSIYERNKPKQNFCQLIKRIGDGGSDKKRLYNVYKAHPPRADSTTAPSIKNNNEEIQELLAFFLP